MITRVVNKYKTLNQIENRLEELYDEGLVNSDEYRELEAKASALADAETKRQERMQASIEAEKIRVEKIKQAFANEDLDLVNTLGEAEFKNDYTVAVEGNDHVIYSRVASDIQNNRWIYTTEEELLKKLRQLYYYRLYDKYVRVGDVTSVKELTL